MHWAQKLAQDFSLSPFVAHMLATRTQTTEEAKAFLAPSLKEHLPDPRCLPDIIPGIECLAKAIAAGETIGIWGDYDVDGATSSALWIRFFRALGITSTAHIPDRFREGYGPNSEGLTRLAAQGITATQVNKVYEGRPNIVDRLKNDDIALVMNTTEGTQAVSDSRDIRAVALYDKIPYFTTAAGAVSAVAAMKARLEGEIGVRTLQG
jgi:hypothetical protein